MKKFLIVTFISFVLISIVSAGPFGMEFGMSITELEKVATIDKETSPGIYKVTPNNSSEYFDYYSVAISPIYGIYSIVAAGVTITSDVYGDKIKQEFNTVASLLTANYGEPSSKFDYLKSGSIWNEPRDWLTAVRKGERVYEYYWNDEKCNLPKPLASVRLKISFLNDYSEKCWLNLGYQPTFFKDASSASQPKKNVF